MEKGSFQNLNLTELNFTEIEERPLTSRTMRNPQHQVLDFTEIPRDIRKSNTVESLISQNEDLMARLKVTFRRMTSLEDENKTLHDEMSEMKRSYASISDQMLVWKEKEKVWKDRHNNLENQIKTFQERFPELEKMEATIDRLKRYQDKVKTTIKPYLQQLKDYAHSLHEQIQFLNKDLNTKDSEISSLTHRLQAVKEERDQQIHFYQMSQNDLVNGFEREKALLQNEISSLQEFTQALELKTQNLDRALERQDELENLRRNKEDFHNEIQSEMDDLRNQNRELKQKLTENQLSQEDLSQEKDQLKKELVSAMARREELEEQMTSLRYMWTAKSEENEKLKISIASLEKLNLELSSKLNEVRKQN